MRLKSEDLPGILAKPGYRDVTDSRPMNEVPSYSLPYPPSANNYWRFVVVHRRPLVLVSREARDYKKRIASQLIHAPRTLGSVGLRLNVFRPRKVGDLDNTIKVLLDSLKGVLFEDDKQVTEISAKRYDDKANPRVEVEVYSVVNET